MKHLGHMYGGFVPTISERGMTDVVPRFKSFNEGPRLAQKCGTHRSDSPIRAL
jgi:hypothetical protein